MDSRQLASHRNVRLLAWFGKALHVYALSEEDAMRGAAEMKL